MNPNRQLRTSGTILAGEQFTAHIAWSKRSDGPMNIVGREFPGPGDFKYNMNGPAGDSERLANRASFLSLLGINPDHTAVPKLEHKGIVRYVNNHNVYIDDLICDALLTERRGLALTMTFADCPPVVLFDGTTGAMAVVHAGWKPIAAGILERTVGNLRSLGAQTGRIRAFVGPGVRKCCYEVGPDVATKIDGIPHHGHVHIDLQDIITMRLVVAGIPIENIDGEQVCTCCGVDSKIQKPLYFSYRREKKLDPLDAGMLVAVVR